MNDMMLNAVLRVFFVATLACVTLQVSAQNVREYYFASLDYYFLTGRQTDFAILDVAAGWSRTGSEFITPTSSTSGETSVGVRRFYFDKIARNQQRGSHFYTLKADEIASVKALNPSNTLAPGKPGDEGDGFRAFAPQEDGSCSNSTTPIYRLFRGNARFPDNPNHRFVSSIAAYNDFVIKGWTGEGVVFCVLASSNVALTQPGSGKQSVAHLDYFLTYTREEEQISNSTYSGSCGTILTVTNNNTAPVVFITYFSWSKGGITQTSEVGAIASVMPGETKSFAAGKYSTDLYNSRADAPPVCERSYVLDPLLSSCYLNPRSNNATPCT